VEEKEAEEEEGAAAAKDEAAAAAAAVAAAEEEEATDQRELGQCQRCPGIWRAGVWRHVGMRMLVGLFCLTNRSLLPYT